MESVWKDNYSKRDIQAHMIYCLIGHVDFVVFTSLDLTDQSSCGPGLGPDHDLGRCLVRQSL